MAGPVPPRGAVYWAVLALVWLRQTVLGIAFSDTVAAGWATVLGKVMPSPLCAVHRAPPPSPELRKGWGPCAGSLKGALGRVTQDQWPFIFPEESQAGFFRTR